MMGATKDCESCVVLRKHVLRLTDGNGKVSCGLMSLHYK